MDKFGVNTQRWVLATSPQEAESGARKLNAKEYVVKAQIHAGGRGKGYFVENNFKGGVHLTTDPKVAGSLTEKMLGNHLVTQQTPPSGVPVREVMIAESLTFDKEYYFAILMDRASQGPVVVASTEGGMDIEKVAEKTPERIFSEKVDITKGLLKDQALKLADQLGFKAGSTRDEAAEQMMRLYKLFIDLDATQVEINPFVSTTEGRVYCVDAKINFDDNASFRQPDVWKLRDTTEEDPREVQASKFNLNYIGMDGNIGCMVNGAGLAMATMDIIKLYNGSPANFLDVGGGANEQQVAEAFKILTSDKQVHAILVNIFGGIMKSDVIAKGIIAAARQVKLSIPLVVRLAGTNVEIAKALIKDSGLPIITAEDLDDAAQKAVAAGRKQAQKSS
jgi:succinyl-CoA synthetase beta subunit